MSRRAGSTGYTASGNLVVAITRCKSIARATRARFAVSW